jgi:hypothetical protein
MEENKSPASKIITLDEVEERLAIEHRKPYYDWTARIVTLSSGALTLLVGLQNNYVADNPKAIWLLQSCWIGLMISILAGLVALYGEAQLFSDARNYIKETRANLGDFEAARRLEIMKGFAEKAIYRRARKLMFLSFALSFLCLGIFSVMNTPHPQTEIHHPLQNQ